MESNPEKMSMKDANYFFFTYVFMLLFYQSNLYNCFYYTEQERKYFRQNIDMYEDRIAKIDLYFGA